ncbi:MAG TPA: hypothetical protein VHO72_07385 [Bacteroidales bacterium]|nr:hypothetical protein [Bacteroidales bacterium]
MVRILKLSVIFYLAVFAWACKKDIVPDETQSESFVKLFGGSPTDNAMDMIVDGGNVAIAGTMKSSVSKAVLICTDKNGNQQPWSPLFVGGSQSIAANKIVKTSDGGYIVIGTQQKSADNKDIFVSRVSSAGIEEWTRYFGGVYNEGGNFGLELSAGGYVIGGYTESYGNGFKDIYLVRIDRDGNEIWQSTIGFGSNESGNDIVELNGWLYVLGYTESLGIAANMFVVQVSSATGKGVNFNYFPNAETYSGSKIGMLPGDKMVLLGVGNSSSYVNCISEDLSSVWEATTPTKEVYNGLAVNGNSIYMVGSKQNQEGISEILIDQYNLNGSKTGSEVISSYGNLKATDVSFFSDGKICISGVATVGNISQIFLIKKEI